MQLYKVTHLEETVDLGESKAVLLENDGTDFNNYGQMCIDSQHEGTMVTYTRLHI